MIFEIVIAIFIAHFVLRVLIPVISKLLVALAIFVALTAALVHVFRLAAMNAYRGLPATLGSSAKAGVRLIVWCLDCRHQVEPDGGDGRALRRRDDGARLAQAARVWPVRPASGSISW